MERRTDGSLSGEKPMERYSDKAETKGDKQGTNSREKWYVLQKRHLIYATGGRKMMMDTSEESWGRKNMVT